jgi:hypothetical protein
MTTSWLACTKTFYGRKMYIENQSLLCKLINVANVKLYRSCPIGCSLEWNRRSWESFGILSHRENDGDILEGIAISSGSHVRSCLPLCRHVRQFEILNSKNYRSYTMKIKCLES